MDAVRTNGAIKLNFRLVTGALHGLSGSPIGFELCAETQASCRYANASASGRTVMLVDDGKPATRVRYAWADNPDKANLYNSEALPAVPFRTDKW